jgi:hypothetical protein
LDTASESQLDSTVISALIIEGSIKYLLDLSRTIWSRLLDFEVFPDIIFVYPSPFGTLVK